MKFEVNVRHHSLCYWTGLRYSEHGNSWNFTDGGDKAFALSRLNISSIDNNSRRCVLICNNGELFNLTSCTQVKHFFCQYGQRPAQPPILTGQDTHIYHAKLPSTYENEILAWIINQANNEKNRKPRN